jgi:hypothetical protein
LSLDLSNFLCRLLRDAFVFTHLLPTLLDTGIVDVATNGRVVCIVAMPRRVLQVLVRVALDLVYGLGSVGCGSIRAPPLYEVDRHDKRDE